MAELKIPQKTLQDNFNLQDFKDDFNALNSEIEENKTLTDSEISSLKEVTNVLNDFKTMSNQEIEELKELINTWTKFKNNGGEIDGNLVVNALTLKGKISTANTTQTFQTSGVDKMLLGGSSNVLAPTSANGLSLGNNTYPWKDLWLGQYNKSQNGYTKFPNGIIMQWGQTTLNTSYGGGRVEVTYPISFPNAPLAQTAQVRSCGNDYTATRMTALGRAWRSTMSIFVQQVSGTIIEDGSTCTIDWIAFGH